MTKVTLIDYTGSGHVDPLYAARLLLYTKNTRLGMGADTRERFAKMTEPEVLYELEYVATTIRSSWEFVDYTFEIESVTRATTQQMQRTRTASFAEQALRVVDLSDFKALKPATVAAADMTHNVKQSPWDCLMKEIARVYSEYKSAGVPVQDCRGVLPLNVQTNMIEKFNLRTAADLLAKRKNLRAQGEYEDIALQMRAEILRVHPWAESFIDPVRNRTPALDAILRRLLGDGSPVDKPELNKALKELDALKEVWG